MKDIRIFVASSKELERERNYLAYLALAYEGEFEKRGFRVRLSKWEYVDPTMTEARTEDRYLDEMLNCDAVLMMFRHVLGMYTKEEVDKAIAAEVAGTSRIGKHLMLFKEGDVEPSAELAAWRATLAEGTYGTFTNFDELKDHFLRLVEGLSGLPLQDIAHDESTRTVSAFLAADDELATDRNAFADAVLNLNDVLARRGARVRLRFYDPEKHRELLESSEMALVLYHTKYGNFGEKALDESFGRSKRDENPKRLYVFFRDANGQPMADGFDAFKDGFADKFGSAPCRFENVDTLSLNFLFSLESILGDDGGTFVKLDGRTVVADGLEVGDLAKLPMLERNEGLASLFSRMQDVSKRFIDQRGKCEQNPQDDGLYVELLDISAEKNRLQDQIDRELKMSFNLAKRLAAVSIAQTNDTIARARAKMDEGKIKEALEILDGASVAMKRRRLLHRAAERAEAEELQIKELKASAEIEYFRIDAVMAYTAMPFNDRFKKAEGIYKAIVEDIGSFALLCSRKNKGDVDLFLAGTLYRFAKSYREVDDSVRPIPILKEALKILEEGSEVPSADVAFTTAEIRIHLARLVSMNGWHAEAISVYDATVQLLDQLPVSMRQQEILVRSLIGRAEAYCLSSDDMFALDEALGDSLRATVICRRLAVGGGVPERGLLVETLRVVGSIKMQIQDEGCFDDFKEAEELTKAMAPVSDDYESARIDTLLRLAGYVGDIRAPYVQMPHADGPRACEDKCLQALDICTGLEKSNPVRYVGVRAQILTVLSQTELAMGHYSRAMALIDDALKLYDILVARNPNRYCASARRLREDKKEVESLSDLGRFWRFEVNTGIRLTRESGAGACQGNEHDGERAHSEESDGQFVGIGADDAEMETLRLDDEAGGNAEMDLLPMEGLSILHETDINDGISDTELNGINDLDVGKEDVSGEDVFDMLIRTPESARDCTALDKISGLDWCTLLSDHPQLEDICDWKKIDDHDQRYGWNWVNLLSTCPQFSNHCNAWERFSAREWVDLLIAQPQFAKYCSFKGFTAGDWVRLLSVQKEFSCHCPWRILTSDNWMELLGNDDSYCHVMPDNCLAGWQWAILLSRNPGLELMCNRWSDFSGYDWRVLLAAQGDLAIRHCDFSKLTFNDWLYVVVHSLQMMEHCPDSLASEIYEKVPSHIQKQIDAGCR